jgi:glycosyltransferase involved in cell wall biosynthesis
MLSRHQNIFDARIYHKEARSLTDAGHEVVIIQQLERDRLMKFEEDGNSTRFHPIRSKGGNKFIGLIRDDRRLAQAVYDEKPDAIHCHDLDTLRAGAGAKKVLGIPLIFDAHEDFPAMAGQSSRAMGTGWKAIQKRLLPKVDKVITVNEIVADTFANHDPVIVRNYPPLWWAEGMRTNLRQFHAPNDETLILYHGCLNNARGPEVMLKVAREITRTHHTRFLFLGRCFDNVRIPKGNDKIQHLGNAPWLQVPDFLLASDIGFCAFNPTPKYLQATPVKIFECMLFGKPFVANVELPVVRDLNRDVVCGMPTKFHKTSLVHNLSVLIEVRDLRRRLGLAGRRAVESKYNWENEAVKLVQLYEEIEND